MQEDARRVAIIGAGRIARAVIAGIEAGEAPGFGVCAVLRRNPVPPGTTGLRVVAGIADLLESAPDLIIEAAGPDALREHGTKALAAADLWTISGGALADREFEKQIEAVGLSSGHRLRLLPGAIGGLDAVAAAACDGDADIRVEVGTTATKANAIPHFVGTAREVVSRFRGVNVVAAVAIAGPGLDATRVAYHPPVKSARRLFTVGIESIHGRYTVTGSPYSTKAGGATVVAASILAALRRSRLVISAG